MLVQEGAEQITVENIVTGNEEDLDGSNGKGN
jgi:hypothetical protein